jgi:hypothetical protein
MKAETENSNQGFLGMKRHKACGQAEKTNAHYGFDAGRRDVRARLGSNGIKTVEQSMPS